MGMILKPLADGMVTGMFLQLAVGPVFFYILGITMDSNYLNSFFAIIAITLADYIFIGLSLFGIGRVLKRERVKAVFSFVSSLILILFGLVIFYKAFAAFEPAGRLASGTWTPAKSFGSCFFLTLSSPLTIVFWGSIFSAKAVEKNYEKEQLAVFGIAAGAATFIFLSLAMLVLTALKSGIPATLVHLLNCMVGLVLVYYGVIRAVTVMRETRQQRQQTKI